MIFPCQLNLRVGSRRFTLEHDPTKYGVVYESGLNSIQRQAVERDVLGAAPPVRYEVPGFEITLIDMSATPAFTRFGPNEARDAMVSSSEARAVYPTYKLGSKRVLPSARVFVDFDPSVTSAPTLAAGTEMAIEYSEHNAVVLALEYGDDLASRIAQLESRPGVRFAEPDLITIAASLRPSPPGISKSSALGEVQRAFLNLRAPDAWNRTGPLDGIRVAVLDDGIDLSHPALASSIVGQFDAFASIDLENPNPWDYHGTSCAGVIGARAMAPDFRGIAAGVSLLAVRISRSPGPRQPWTTSNDIVRRGINWAIENGADILSNSWGGPPSAMVAKAIQNGIAQGRNSKGSVFVFAAGNTGGPVEFPGTLNGVIAVSGVTLNDEPKTFSSSDGETWWASNQGPEIDLAAPSVKITTSDIQGEAGRTVDDWRHDFNGTSAACPMVAGAAAVVLSVAPQLSSAEVIATLTDSADKVGTLVSAQTERDNRLGYGRLNVFAALMQAAPGLTLIGTLTRIPLSAEIVIYGILTAQGESAYFAVDDSIIQAIDGAVASGEPLQLGYDAREQTPIGFVLYGVRIVPATSPSDQRDGNDTPRPKEVLLPRPEDDIFAKGNG